MQSSRRGSPTVSVVMAVFDGEQFVAEAVDSILSQSFSDLELIVVNDGSIDGTAGILESYQDCRLRVLSQDNNGLTRSLVRAAECAQGKYIARQDSDDVSDPVRIERQVQYLEAHPDVVLLGTSAVLIDACGEEFGRTLVETDPEAISRKLDEENQFVHGSILMRAEAFRRVGGYREQFLYGQDYDLVARLSERWKVANLKEAYYFRRVSPDMISMKYNAVQVGFRDLAKTLRIERMTTGSDRLDTQAVVKELDEIARCPQDPHYLDRHRKAYTYTCLRHGHVGQARRAVVEQIRRNPVQWRPYMHFVLTLMGRAAVVKILRWWDGWRND